MVRLHTPADLRCEDVAPTFRLAVADPENQPVEHSAEFHSFGQASNGYLEVSFPTAQPGEYHVHAELAFLGRDVVMQRDVTVFEDHTAATFVELPAACNRLQRTSLGAFLCDGQVFRDGAEVQRLTGELRVAGNVVWRWADGQIERWVESDRAGLQAGFPFVDAMDASEDDLIVFAEQKVYRFMYGSNGLTVLGPTQMPTSLGLPPTMTLREGALVFAIEASTRSIGPPPPFCYSTWEVSSTPALVSEANDLMGFCSNASLPGTPVAAGDGWLWTRQEDGSVRLARPSGTRLQLERSAALPKGFSLSAPGGGGPVVLNRDGDWVLPRVTDQGVRYERYAWPGTVELLGADDQIAWGRPVDAPSRTRVFVRYQ